MAPAPHARLQMIGSRETEPGSTYLRPPTNGTGPADPATEEAIVSVTINWAQCHTRPVLMIPGPTELPFPVIQAMNQPPSIQYDRRFDLTRLEREAERIRPKALTLVHNETSTGTTYPAAEVAKIARSVGALFLLDTVSSIAGIDVRTDEWGVDLNMTGSQKCLAAPIGMGLVSVSPRAWEAMERRKRPATSYTYDLLRWREWWIPVSRGGKVPDGTGRRQPVSIPTHLTSAMQVAVRLILEEGLPQRFRRHEIAASALRAGVLGMGLEMFPDPSLWSNTVASIRAPKDVETAAVVQRMRDQYGILIGTGLDKIRTTTLRIGTMGMTASPHYVLPTLSAFELALRDLGYKADPGAGLAGAQEVFANNS